MNPVRSQDLRMRRSNKPERAIKSRLRREAKKNSTNSFLTPTSNGVKKEEPIKVAFVDRDGTLIYEPPETKQIDSVADLKILRGVTFGLRNLIQAGYKLVIVSNQDGLGTKNYPKAEFDAVQKELLKELKRERIDFDEIFVCPHLSKDNCKCRKPKDGLVKNFLKKNKIDKAASFMVGDRQADAQFAKNIGVRFIEMKTNGRFPRISAVRRTTKETDILVQCNLDGKGEARIETGLGFFNHMLEQLAKHSLIDLTIIAKGDLEIDEHHTIEDTALALGQALSSALGDRSGIERYGFLLPMDDTLVEAAIDLGGRPYLTFNCEFKREMVGDLPTEMVSHFFRSLAEALKANIHINVRYSENEHHKIEATFKAFARALRMAVERNPRAPGMPSTKGKLV